MIDQNSKITAEPIKSNTAPVGQVFRQSIKEAANGLPPAPGFIKDRNKLPTDEEVLGSTKLSSSLSPEEDTEEHEEDETPIELIVTEPIGKENKNENSEKAVKDIGGERIENFNIEDEDTLAFVKDLYKGNTPEGSEITEDKKSPVVDEKAFEEKYKPYVEKAKEFDSVISDPLTKALIEFRKAGGTDIGEFVKSVGYVNVEGMSERELIEFEGKQEGLTPEEIEAEYESLESMTPLAKRKHLSAIKADVAAKRDEKLKTFTAGNEDARKSYEVSARVAKTELEELIPKMSGKKYEGLLITPEMAKRIEQYVIDRAEPIVNNGKVVGFDIKGTVESAVAKLYRNEWKKSLIELGRTMGADKALTARVRPNKNEVSSAIPPIKQGPTFDDIAKSHADKLWKKRGIKG